MGGVTLLALNTNAQNAHRCWATEAEQLLRQEYPNNDFEKDFQAQVKAYLAANANNIANRGSSRLGDTVIYVPVVFHIVQDNGLGNLTDAKIYQEMQNLNEYWSMSNWDLAALHPYFDTLKGNMKVEFRLAHLDPQGNCTNGIERINAWATRRGDDYAKFNQWNHEKYVNIWTTLSLVNASAAAYAYKPGTACDPSLNNNGRAERDGIISRSSYIGYATSQDDRSTIAHEMGHIMNLDHVWGGSNSPEVGCGDDDVYDTPPSKGYQSCVTNKNTMWSRDSACWKDYAYKGWKNPISDPTLRDNNLVSNVQNIMEYSYCSVNFTHGQYERTRAAFELQTSCRFPLFQAANLVATGTANPYTQLNNCTPKAMFAVDKKYVCTGVPVKFTDFSSNGTIDNYFWTLPADASVTAGNTGSSTVTATFSTPGWKTITLEVSNALGSNTISKTEVYVDDNSLLIDAPYLESFEGTTASKWVSVDYDNDGVMFKKTNTGLNSSNCMFVNNYNSIKDQEPSWLISPAFNTSNLPANATITFYASVAKGNGGTIDDSLEILNVYGSKDCGATWVVMKTKGYSKSDLINAGIVTSYYIAGQTDDYWRKYTLPLVVPGGGVTGNFIAPNVKFRFEFQSSHNGNNFFIDNINVGTATTGIENNKIDVASLNIFPNPSNGNATVQVALENAIENVSIKMYDMVGKEVADLFNGKLNKGNSEIAIVNQTIPVGVYMIQMNFNGQSIQRKFVKF